MIISNDEELTNCSLQVSELQIVPLKCLLKMLFRSHLFLGRFCVYVLMVALENGFLKRMDPLFLSIGNMICFVGMPKR